MIRGIKRFMGEKNRKPKLPVTIPLLSQIISLYASPLSIIDLNYISAITLAVCALLRSGEFTAKSSDTFDPAAHLTRGCVRFEPSIDNPSYICLFIPTSKTDPFRQGVTLYVAAAPDSLTCPVTCLKSLFTRNPLPPNSPLFVSTNNSPLLRNELIARLRHDVASLGLDSTKFAGHSFRRGGASSAFAAGLSDFEIQQLGRWRSDTFKLYIEPNRERLLSISSRMHWAVPVAQNLGPLDLLRAI